MAVPTAAKEVEHMGKKRADLVHKQTLPSFSSRSQLISLAVCTSLPFPCLLPSSSIPRSQHLHRDGSYDRPSRASPRHAARRV